MAIPQIVQKWLSEMEQQARTTSVQAETTLEAIRTLQDFHNTHESKQQASTTEEITKGIIEVLLASGKLMHRDGILSDLELNGIIVGGKTPVSNVSAILSRMPQVQSYGAGNWGLRLKG